MCDDGVRRWQLYANERADRLVDPTAGNLWQLRTNDYAIAGCIDIGIARCIDVGVARCFDVGIARPERKRVAGYSDE